jgi:hypothetical protein
MDDKDLFEWFCQVQPLRVQDGQPGAMVDRRPAERWLVIMLPQLGDFDSLEYAWWLQRHADDLKSQGVQVRAVGIGDFADEELDFIINYDIKYCMGRNSES